ncbi:helix-turn-helix domain-containing protein [Streptomyces sp. NPDC101115]|uniref:helix-turn-helix domain-containing protein n=1 Tax=Streptomyces sp. NPDC101115 TaxID=3366106 RepID=UPI00381A3848
MPHDLPPDTTSRSLRRPYLRAGEHRDAVAAILRREYEAGASARVLSLRYDLSRGTTQRLLAEAGTPMRPANAPRAAAPRPATGDDIDAIVVSWLLDAS